MILVIAIGLFISLTIWFNAELLNSIKKKLN